jgi:hypothetical protein
MKPLDVAVRWEGRQWRAYNIGAVPPFASHQDWSTALGELEVEEIQTLFRNVNLTFWPAL